MDTCAACAAGLEPGARFCESCGAAVAAVAGDSSTAAGPAGAAASPDDPDDPAAGSPLDEQLGSGPISVLTQPTRLGSPVPQGPRPCLQCGAVIGPDGYCESCGVKAPRARDHFRESPASWVAGVCDRGIRHSRNEDAMALLASPLTGAAGEPPPRGVLVVLDGVSSSADSDVASLAGAQAAREVLRTPLPQGMGTPQSRTSAITRAMADAVEAAHRAIIATTPADSLNPASATFVCGVVEGPTLTYANVGDSRIYWLPDVGEPLLLSVDDSGAQLQMAVGVAREVAEASAGAHAITKWLGRDSHDVKPRVGQLELTAPGWVLVCSDGLWNYASAPEAIAEQVRLVSAERGGPTDPAVAADAAGPAGPTVAAEDLALGLVDFANASGGIDNITVALARFDPVPPTIKTTATPGTPAGDPRENHG